MGRIDECISTLREARAMALELELRAALEKGAKT